MKWIKYQIVCGENENGESILLNKKVGYSAENIAIANEEAYDGYVIVDDEQSFEKEPLAIEFGGTGAKTAAEAVQKLGAAPASHTTDKSNPHGVTKAQVGLGNVPNVATNDQTPTYSQASSLSNLVSGEKVSVSFGKIMKAIADLISHIGNKSNPHGVTKTQVGLGNVPNVATNDQAPTYSDVTTLSTLASGEKLSVAFPKIKLAITGLINHTGNKSNPHGVTKSQVGLGNVPNVATNDQTPTFTAASKLETLASGERLSTSFGKITKAITDLISHIGNKSNPHGVTKAQVGLGSVDNTADSAKPISTAQATAIADAKKAGTDAQSSINSHTGNKSNPHGVTKSQVGLSNVPNVSTNDQTPTYSQASTLANLVSGEKLSVSFGKIMKAIADLISHLSNKSNPHGVTASGIGAAPDGYGLGKQSAPALADANEVTPAKFFRVTSNTANLGGTTHWVGVVVPYASDEAAQLMIRCGNRIGHTKLRATDDGVTWEDMHINPPMVAGTEYKTIEFTDSNNRVYCKRVSHTFTTEIGNASGNVDITVPHGIEDFGKLVRIVGIAGYYQLPYISSAGGVLGIKSVDSNYINLRAYKASIGAQTATFDVYYTKS